MKRFQNIDLGKTEGITYSFHTSRCILVTAFTSAFVFAKNMRKKKKSVLEDHRTDDVMFKVSRIVSPSVLCKKRKR
jgi:uncharacterized membrane protein